MNIQQESIDIYIHPDDGPIMPMQLNMMEVELSVIHSGIQSRRDEARVKAIVELIRQKFPSVQPEAKRQQLSSLNSRLVHVQIYDGIVLRLPGRIDGPPPPKTYDLADVQKLEEQVANLISMLQSERQKAKELAAENKTEIETLRHESDSLRAENRKWQGEKKRLTEELDEAEEQELKATMEVNVCRKQIADLQQDKAEMQAELDKAQRENKQIPNLQRDVASLRTKLRDRDEEVKDLREENNRVLQENKELREKMRKFVEDLSQSNSSSSKGDDAKGSYLD